MSDSFRVREFFVLEEYENPKIKDFIAKHETQFERDLVAETVTFLINEFPEIADTLKGKLINVYEEELHGSNSSR